MSLAFKIILGVLIAALIWEIVIEFFDDDID